MGKSKDIEHTVEFQLARMARKAGGDRYEAEYGGQDWVIYVPQVLSRPDGEAKESLTFTIK